MSDRATAGRPTGSGARSPCAVSLAAWLAEGRRGAVEVQSPGGACRLELDGGVLRLAADDPLATRLDAARGDLEPLIALLALATSESLRFTPTSGVVAGAAPAGAPLPAPTILMEAAVRGRDRAQLWALLGGRPVVLRMSGGSVLSEQALARIEPRLQALLSRFVKARAARELVGDDEAGFATLRDLARLRVVGLVAPTEAAADSAPGAALSERSVELFERRIARELERRPLRLSPAEHRRQLVELLRNQGVWNHYELLRVGRHDDEQAIHRGYVEVARLAHPSHAEALGLEGRAAALELLFEAATEAYLVLSHPDRRRAYDRDLAPELGGPASDERRREKAAVARDMYLRARKMTLEQEFQPVLELMQQAVLLDPQAEYYALLGQVQRRNPQWKAGALASYRDAVRCRPNDPSLRFGFAQVLEEMGDRAQAGVQYRAALELRPGDERIRAAIDALEGGSARGGGAGSSLLSSLLALFRRGDAGEKAEPAGGEESPPPERSGSKRERSEPARSGGKATRARARKAAPENSGSGDPDDE